MAKFEKSAFCEMFVALGTSALKNFFFQTWMFLKSRPLSVRLTWCECKIGLCSSRMSFKISVKFAAKSKTFTHILKKLLEIVTNTNYNSAK